MRHSCDHTHSVCPRCNRTGHDAAYCPERYPSREETLCPLCHKAAHLPGVRCERMCCCPCCGEKTHRLEDCPYSERQEYEHCWATGFD